MEKGSEATRIAELEAQLERLKTAAAGFLWIGRNIDNIKHDPDRFREFFEAAVADLKEAMEP